MALVVRCHANETAHLFHGGRHWHVRDRLYVLRIRTHTSRMKNVPEILHLRQEKLTFLPFDSQTILFQPLEDCLEILQMLGMCLSSHQKVIQVNCDAL